MLRHIQSVQNINQCWKQVDKSWIDLLIKILRNTKNNKIESLIPYHSFRSFINFWNFISRSLRAHSLKTKFEFYLISSDWLKCSLSFHFLLFSRSIFFVLWIAILMNCMRSLVNPVMWQRFPCFHFFHLYSIQYTLWLYYTVHTIQYTYKWTHKTFTLIGFFLSLDFYSARLLSWVLIAS